MDDIWENKLIQKILWLTDFGKEKKSTPNNPINKIPIKLYRNKNAKLIEQKEN